MGISVLLDCFAAYNSSICFVMIQLTIPLFFEFESESESESEMLISIWEI